MCPKFIANGPIEKNSFSSARSIRLFSKQGHRTLRVTASIIPDFTRSMVLFYLIY